MKFFKHKIANKLTVLRFLVSFLFIALMAITLLVACLIIIGMFIEREASNKELPRLKPQVTVHPQPENKQ